MPTAPSFPQPPFAREKKRKGLPRGAKIAIIAGSVTILLIALVIVLAVVFFVGVITEPADVANAYARALNEGDLSTAWGYLARATQKDVGRGKFDREKIPYKGNIEKWNTPEVKVQSGGRAQVGMNLRFKNGDETSWSFDLVKENGKYKILNLRVGGGSD